MQNQQGQQNKTIPTKLNTTNISVIKRQILHSALQD